MRNWLLHTMSQRAEPSLPAAGNLCPTCLRPLGNFFLFPRCWHRFRSFSRSELYWWWWSLFFFGRYDSPLVSASLFFLARGFWRFSTRSWGFRATSFCRESRNNTGVKLQLCFGSRRSAKRSQGSAAVTRKGTSPLFTDVLSIKREANAK